MTFWKGLYKSVLQMSLMSRNSNLCLMLYVNFGTLFFYADTDRSWNKSTQNTGKSSFLMEYPNEVI